MSILKKFLLCLFEILCIFILLSAYLLFGIPLDFFQWIFSKISKFFLFLEKKSHDGRACLNKKAKALFDFCLKLEMKNVPVTFDMKKR